MEERGEGKEEKWEGEGVRCKGKGENGEGGWKGEGGKLRE